MRIKKEILIILGVGIGIFALSQFSKPVPKTKEVGKNETAVEVDSEETSSKPKETLANLLYGKYLYNDIENRGIGEIFCFTKEEIVVLYTYEAGVHKVKSTSSDANSAIFELESSEHGSPENILSSRLKVVKTNDTSVSLEWSSSETSTRTSKKMKILNAEECVRAIAKAHPDYKHDQNWDELGLTKELFTKVFGAGKTNNSSTEGNISPEEALQLCKNKLAGVVNADYLNIANNTPGLPSSVKHNGVNYIYVYYTIDGIAADFRYCVRDTDGSIFFEDAANPGKFVDIDTYISRETDTSTSTNNSTSNKISENEAISICDKKLRDIGNYNESSGLGIILGILYDKFYHIMYEDGESYLVNMYTGEVHYLAPAGDGYSDAL